MNNTCVGYCLPEFLTIEDFLCQQDINCVTESGSCSRHCSDDGVFFHVEWAIVKSKRVSKNAEDTRWHDLVPSCTNWICDQLNDRRWDVKLFWSQSEENIAGANNCAENKTNGPCSDGVDREFSIISRANLIKCEYRE